MVRENRLFLGNPGTGKSTLINCLIGEKRFEAGISWAVGGTKAYQRFDRDDVAYMDTPGLADEAILEQAARAITTALKQSGNYKLFFMVRLQNGRVVSEDIVTLERVLDSIEVTGVDQLNYKYTIIMNGISPRQYNTLLKRGDEFKKIKTLMNRKYLTESICLIPRIPELEETDDIVDLPQLVVDAMNSAPVIKIEKQQVRAIDMDGFTQQAHEIRRELEELRLKQSTLQRVIQEQEKRHEETMRLVQANHAAEIHRMRNDCAIADPSEMSQNDYSATPLTPTLNSSQPEKHPLWKRKKMIMASIVTLVLVIALIIGVLVATRNTGGGDAKATAKDNDSVSPDEYVDKMCEQPNYISKSGRLFAAFKSGTEVQLDIKGVNWMGMQDPRGVPKGLMNNMGKGATLDRVGQFLSSNNFNGVRLALSIDSALRNVEIATSLINTTSQRALTATRYNDLKDSIGKTATWGDGSNTDWAAAATSLGNHVLTVCPKWVSFVGGVQGDVHKDVFDGNRVVKNKFFAGSDLSNVDRSPIMLSASNKIVYSPKYWSSSFLPLPYFFDAATAKGDMLDDYTESSDSTLSKNVKASMNYMFSPAMESGSAVILSSFGGLVGTNDLTKMKTSTRIIDVVIEQMRKTDNSLAGGFWYTLNPETTWPYPAPNVSNATSSGLVDSTWRAANQDVLTALKKMDTMMSVQTIPCVTG